MKRILIFSLVLASIAGASGWDLTTGSSGNPIADVYFTTTHTNAITSISGAAVTFTATDTIGITLFRKGTFVDTLKIKTTKPVMFGAVSVKDTLTNKLRILTPFTDTLYTADGNAKIYKYNGANIVMWNAPTGWEHSFSVNGSGVLNFSPTAITDYSTAGITGSGTGAISAYERLQGDTLLGLKRIVCGATNIDSASGTITTAKVSNSATVGVKVASDSLIITPEGGIAVLMKNAADSTVYRGSACAVSSYIQRGFIRCDNAGLFSVVGMTYSDSIVVGGWGYVTINGIGYFAIKNGEALSGGKIFMSGDNKRTIRSAASVSPQALDGDGNYYVGTSIDSVRVGANARGDSLTRGIVRFWQTPSISTP